MNARHVWHAVRADTGAPVSASYYSAAACYRVGQREADRYGVNVTVLRDGSAYRTFAPTSTGKGK